MSNVILNGKNVHSYISDTGKYCYEYQNDTVYTLTRVSDSLREIWKNEFMKLLKPV